MNIYMWDKPERPTEAEVKQQVRDSGLEAMRWTGDAHQHWNGHHHSREKTLWCAAGDITFYVDDKPVHLQAGDKMVLPPETIHTADAGANGVVCYESPPVHDNTSTYID